MNDYSASTPIPTETVEMELDTSSIIEIIINQLQGRVWDHVKKEYKQIGTPLVNKKGEKKIATVLASYISRDKILSVLSARDIDQMTQEVTESMVIILQSNYKEFNIRTSDLPLILKIIEHSVYANLKRAEGGRTLDHIGNIVKVKESEEKGGSLPYLNTPMGGQ